MSDRIVHKLAAPSHSTFNRVTVWSVRCSCGWSASAFDSASKLTPFVERHLTEAESEHHGNRLNGVQV